MSIKLPLPTPLVLCAIAGILTGCTHPAAPFTPRTAHTSDANVQSQRTEQYILQQRTQHTRWKISHH